MTTAIGVKYSTFYRHYLSLDALITDLVDDVIATELVIPDTGHDWRNNLRETCSELSRLLGGRADRPTARGPGAGTATDQDRCGDRGAALRHTSSRPPRGGR